MKIKKRALKMTIEELNKKGFDKYIAFCKLMKIKPFKAENLKAYSELLERIK